MMAVKLSKKYRLKIREVNIFFKKLIPYLKKYYLCISKTHARVAELVDASVSKTDEVTLVPVRFRPRVQK